MNYFLTGRVTALTVTTQVVHGQQIPELLVASAGGGVYRTTNDFRTQAPVYEALTDGTQVPVDPTTGLGAGAIDDGSITVGPGPLPGETTIYVGTGETNGFVDDRYGTGVLTSDNNGRSWNFSPGTPTQAGIPGDPFFRHSISKMLVDPRNPNVVYATVMNDGTGNEKGSG